LRGRVLPIGGLKEKLLAAHRTGIRTFIMPKKNAKDLEEVPRKIQRDLALIMVTSMDEVLKAAMAREVFAKRRKRRAPTVKRQRAKHQTSTVN
jgi:ATP-dependent Lon protease